MPDYVRSYVEGGTYFFTTVTYGRYPIFQYAGRVRLFLNCIREIQTTYRFRVDALVVLPDHIHTIWTLPANDHDYSSRWKRVKGRFTHRFREGPDLPERSSMKAKGEKAVWQRRFWEHAIRDNEDLAAHIDYIHYNPVKHGLARLPSEWPYSTFAEYVAKGVYEIGWGAAAPPGVTRMELE